MRLRSLMTFVGWYGVLVAPLCAGAPDVGRPALVREVLDGKRQEARASWWGFEPHDSTEFLQNALHSNVKRLIVDRQASAWVTRPLSGVSDQEIVFEAGTELVALKGAFQAKGDCLLSFRECHHVTVRGAAEAGRSAARLRMQKADYQSDAYAKSEWRHGLVFSGCRDVLVQDLTIEQTGGDGIYLGASSKTGSNRNVVIRRVDCHANHRQGISVISAENLLIEDCRLRHTQGTAPQAGIDFEPNHWTDVLVHCVVRRCLAEGNSGTGYQICPQYLSGRSKPMSIYLEDCVSRNNGQHGVHMCTAQQDAPGGLLHITGFVSEDDGMAGLSCQFNPWDAVRIEVIDSVLRDCARQDSFFPPIFVQSVNSGERPGGNIHFQRVLVEDDLDRPFFRISDPKGNGLKDVTGQIILERCGQKETIVVDDAWLRKISGGSSRP